MVTYGEKRVSRSELFGQDAVGASIKRHKVAAKSEQVDIDDDDIESDNNDQDFAAFERMMEARINACANDSIEPHEDDSGSESVRDDDHDQQTDTDPAPVFQLFAGAGPVKVSTKVEEPVYIQTERPEEAMVESDSEDHWNRLAAAAIDSQEVLRMAQIPLPALRFAHRVMHIKTDSKDEEQPTKETPRKKSKSKTRSEPYTRVLSPYTGGVIRGKMLEDVLREEKAASAARVKSMSRGGGRGGTRGASRGR
ncbi:hypothetical protein GGI05_004175, partial [Coemansia sp. RSA 2603]